MYVLVAYATRSGPTITIAERIANGLRANGLHARVEPIVNVKSVAPYQAVILGGNAHMSHWLDGAVRFARHNRKELADRAVWLFSTGPEGTARGVAEHTTPQEFHQLVKLVEPRGQHVFAGSQPGMISQEDEAAIQAWTEEIAAELLVVP
jgi:menaquinone-dependent protoporphyrinogen oxidase